MREQHLAADSAARSAILTRRPRTPLGSCNHLRQVEADPGEAYTSESEPVEVAPEPSPYVPPDVDYASADGDTDGAQRICVEPGTAVLPSASSDGVQAQDIQPFPPACIKYVNKGWVALTGP